MGTAFDEWNLGTLPMNIFKAKFSVLWTALLFPVESPYVSVYGVFIRVNVPLGT